MLSPDVSPRFDLANLSPNTTATPLGPYASHPSVNPHMPYMCARSSSMHAFMHASDWPLCCAGTPLPICLWAKTRQARLTMNRNRRRCRSLHFSSPHSPASSLRWPSLYDHRQPDASRLLSKWKNCLTHIPRPLPRVISTRNGEKLMTPFFYLQL